VFGGEAVRGNKIRIIGADFVCIRIEIGWERKPDVQRHLTDL
jgi:hypothetical protein